MVEKFVAEVFGTAILILLGDGVVAGVLLAKSKAQNAGWIVITWRGVWPCSAASWLPVRSAAPTSTPQ
jgi:glycerol uptake facilitator-like aquaporin